ncbi:MAG: PSD1 and planctomycete cytochrome C domain-containing protein [Planctomycetaceae bacterium]
MNSTLFHRIALIAFAMGFAGSVRAAEGAEPNGIEFFERKIRPVLLEHCYECHSSKSKSLKGGLNLESRDGLLKGGDSGPSIVPGKTEESLLLEALRHDGLEMPPKQKLSDAVIRDFEQWIRIGAPDPRTAPKAQSTSSINIEEGRRFWAFQPVANHPAPAVRNTEWPRNPIDHFILAALEAKGLTPSPDASKEVLLRRITFDLTGLPPTPAELDEFTRDDSLDAFERVVDRLLASPHFGECWGRHWLDVARFAESSGGGRSMLFPEAWRFRDYVVQSFNDDKPFDRFLTEQIAGDLLPFASEEQQAEMLIATGFLVLGPHNYEEQDKSALEMDVVDEQLDTLGRTVLGMTLGCARCHDHKFDPVPTRDYYALAGIFRSTDWLQHENVSRWSERALPVEPQLAAALKEHEGEVAKFEKQIEDLKSTPTTTSTSGSAAPTGESAAASHPAQLKQLQSRLSKLKEAAPYRPAAMAVREATKIEDETIRIRGNVHSKGAVVPRGFLQVATVGTPRVPSKKESGRRELAAWLVDRTNPLTARVFANRVWHHLFGTGLVRTVDNFGSAGERPSHPELLDHLAGEAVRNQWSTQRLVREIVLSRAYAQSYAENPQAVAIDPENRLLWRANRKRIAAESLRDAMLVASARLDTTIGGPTIRGLARSKKDEPSKEYDYVFDDVRRSVYTPVLRNRLPEIFEAFDFSDPNQPVGARNASTTASQALVLMNGGFVIEQARHAGKNLAAIPELSDIERIEIAYRTTLGRSPNDRERKAIGDALTRAAATSPAAAASERWERLYQALFASVEFRYLE